ncbi:MAG TPA: hemerythrin domain-containing protein [Armatimonadota bacterium]|nr:hemerythrin domain-containing protein [Armatimonadota bacterium]
MPVLTRNETADAVEMLKADHEKVRGLFRQFFETGERAIKTRQKLADQIFHEIEVHARLEEEVFYPAVRAVADEQGEDVVAESVEEHHVVELLLGELKALSPEDEQFEPKMKVLFENVDHHIEEEETVMLPDARKKLKSQAEALSLEMQTLRAQLTGSAH